MTDTTTSYTPDERQLDWIEQGVLRRAGPDGLADYRRMLAEDHAAALEPQPERNQVPTETAQALAKPEVIQFPFWPDTHRAAPNAFLRSALFGVVKKGARKRYRNAKLATWEGNELSYTGEQLDQYDLDVFCHLVHICRQQGIEPGKLFHVNAKARSFWGGFGRARGGDTALRFYDSVDRMKATSVKVRVPFGGERVKLFRSLIESAAQVEGKEQWAVILDPVLIHFFAPGEYSWLDWDARHRLKTQLAQWLQGHVASHDTPPGKPHRDAVTSLHELCGSQSELKRFRFNLRLAMKDLKRLKLVTMWRITDNDALEFTRPMSRSRQKKLVKKAIRQISSGENHGP